MQTNQNENEKSDFFADEQAVLLALKKLLESVFPEEAIRILDDDALLHSWGQNNNFAVSSSQSGLNYYLKEFYWTLFMLQLKEKEEKLLAENEPEPDECFDFLPVGFITSQSNFSAN